MDHLTYTKSDSGYVTLWPPRGLGDDFKGALGKIKGGLAPRAASGYALARVGKSEHLPSGIDLDSARIFATQWTDLEPVTICEAVAIGLNDTVMFRRVERLQSCERFDEIPDDAELVAPTGEIMMKAVADPKMPRGFDQLADRLTRGLAYEDRKWFKPYLKKYLNIIRVDWKKLTAARHREIWNKAERVIKKADVRRLTQPWTQRVTLDMTTVVKGTKKHLREHYLPRLNTALTQPDTRAIKQIGKQQGWYLRDQMGKRSETLTKHGERIVKRGLKDGWGREQIAKELEKNATGMWQKYGRNYSMAVASVALSRARSWSEVKSYQDISIEQLELQAILDEVTTETCILAGTQILIPDGKIYIEHVVKGQEVITGTGETHKVIAIMQRKTNKFLKLTHSLDSHILITGNHPILTKMGWKKAGELKKGDLVATKRSKKKRSLGNSDVLKLQEGIRSEKCLCKQRTNEVLFDSLSSRVREERIYPQRHDQKMYHVREGFQGKPQFRDSWKGQKTLLNEMSPASGNSNLSGMRTTIYNQGIYGEAFREELLFNSMQRTRQRDDQCGEMDVRGIDYRRMGMGERVCCEELLNRFCSYEDEACNRSGWWLLARQANGKRATSQGITEEKRSQNKRGRISSCETEWSNNAEPQKQIPADAIYVEEYIRAVDEWATIESIVEIFQPGTTVYNLEVETDHTYIAEGIVVHNCRFLDGQVISVNESADLIEKGANVSNPEDIRSINPFINVRKDQETGQRSLFTATGTKLAEITRSGYGARDDRGEFKANVFGNKLPSSANIGLPPYHFRCRTYTLPKTTLVQIPKGYQAQAVPIPPRPVPIKPRRVKPKPTKLAPPRKVQPRPALITGDRPVSIVKTPTRGKPTDVGYKIPQPDDPYARPGLIENVSLEKQMIERSQRAMKKLSDSIAKQQKKLGRPLTRNEIGGNLVKSIQKEVGPSQSISGLTPPHKQHKRAYKGKKKLTELYNEATGFTGERLMKELKRKGMASIVPIRGYGKYQSGLKRISINPQFKEHLRHEYGHHLSTLGKNLEAEVLFRKRHTTGTSTTSLPGGGRGKVGNWGDQYCSREYKGNTGIEVFSQVNEYITTDKKFHSSLANLWEANPEHIGFALSYLQGAFV